MDEEEKVFTEDEINNCRLPDGTWSCPVAECTRTLSRKQTLKSHLMTKHSVKGGRLPNKYKLYENDESIPIPKSTKYLRFTQESSSQEASSDQAESIETQDLSQISEEGTSIERLEDLSKAEMNRIVSDYMDDHVERDMELCDGDESDDLYSSDDDDDDSINSNSSCKDDAPLYCFPASEQTYLSSITRNEHVISLCAYAAKNNLSNSAFKQLMQLVKIHLPQNNLCETDPNVIKDECDFTSDFIKYHDYCDSCGALYPENKDSVRCETDGCQELRYANQGDRYSKTYFVTGSLEKQLNEVVCRNENVQYIVTKSQRAEQSDIFDIQDGSLYKKMTTENGFLNHNKTNVSLTMFTDGVSLFKSTQTSYWPVYLVINELPPKERFLRKNMILWGLWQGVGKPRMNTFFFPFVNQMRQFYSSGIDVNVGEQHYNVKATVCVVTMDLQARAYLFNMKQHNGRFGCIFCEQEGENVTSGKGHCWSYPWMLPKSKLRTTESVAENSSHALARKDSVLGFYGKSVLSFLPNFAIPNNVGIDYMHGVLLGVTKKLISNWFDAKSYQEPYFIGHLLKDVDKRLKSIKQPYLIHRKPRGIQGNVNHWKASEFRSWLLFYSVPCLQGILPDNYFYHYCCLVEGIFLLLGERIGQEQLVRAETLLNLFYELAADLYGANINGINVHNLSHLIDQVRNWGPLWVYSCFAFESFNGEINKTIHGKGNISREVFWALYREKILEESVQKLSAGECKKFVQSLIKPNRDPQSSILAHKCNVHEPVIPLNFNSLNQSLKNNIQHELQTEKNLKKAQKISSNDFTFYSEQCTRVKTSKSNIALLTEPKDGCTVIEIKYFIYSPETMRTIAVGGGMESTGSYVERRVPHIIKIKQKCDNLVVPAEIIKEPVVYMKINGQEIIAKFPNFIERD